jgi:hypothetical protein
MSLTALRICVLVEATAPMGHYFPELRREWLAPLLRSDTLTRTLPTLTVDQRANHPNSHLSSPPFMNILELKLTL